MNIHLSPDDKFSNDYIHICNGISALEQEYICVKKESLSFIDDTIPNVSMFNNSNEVISYLLNKEYERLIIHALYGHRFEIVKALKEVKSKFIWVFYGNDGYKFVKKNILEPKTLLSVIFNKAGSNFKIINAFKYIKGEFDKFRLSESAQVFKRIDYFAFWLRSDFEMLKNVGLLNEKAIFLPFFYGSFLDSGNTLEYNPKGVQSLILGNSADFNNNHLDVISKLSKKIHNIKVYCPLSYGGADWYKEKVAMYSKDKIGENFVPLIEYMPKDLYFKLIKSVDAGVFYHIRQQGASNVSLLLSTGKRVYLNKKSPILKFYRDIGCKVFTVEDFGVYDSFTYDDAINNQKAMQNYFSKDKRSLLISKLLNV